MKKYHTNLTSEEQALVDELDFEVGSRKAYLTNKNPIVSLMHSLIERNAIPDHRWKHWINPEFNLKSPVKKSNKELFEQNGNKGDKAYEHSHFIAYYLPYMLYGPNLPDEIIKTFETELENESICPEWFTSGDHSLVWKTSRKLARTAIRKYRLDKENVANEFWKLCLDMGFDKGVADSTRRQVMQIKV